MFTVHCPRHDAQVLVFPSGVDAIVNEPTGPVVHYHCTCGHRGVWNPRGAARTLADDGLRATA